MPLGLARGITVGSAVAVAVAVACGGGGGNGGHDGGLLSVAIETTADNLCDQVAEVTCHDIYQCCEEGEIEKYLGVTDPRSEADCRSDVAKLCRRNSASYATSLAAATVKFDGSAMDACLQSVLAPAGTCATIAAMLPWTTACMTSAWTGLVASGGTCHYTYECAGSDSTCAPDQTCTLLPQVGQSCNGVTCGVGLYCNSGDRLCHALGGTGDPCGDASQCSKGLFCDPTMTACEPLHVDGDSCTNNSMCVSASCVPGLCAGTINVCYTDLNCGRHCNGTATFCTTDSNCAVGTCSVSGPRASARRRAPAPVTRACSRSAACRECARARWCARINSSPSTTAPRSRRAPALRCRSSHHRARARRRRARAQYSLCRCVPR